MRRIIVGVSGGADSTALLLLLVDLRDARLPRAFPEILVGHVHHGLRAGDADEDEAFVRDLARKTGCRILVGRGDAAREAARRRLSPEAAARFLRHGFFRKWAAETDADAVFLAHHRDDQAETVLLRAVRGAGIRGLSGMAANRPLVHEAGTSRIVRPLLDWPRSSIIRYLQEMGQPYRVDATNEDMGVPRNRIRHEVLPLLERSVQPGAAGSLARLAAIAGDVARDLDELGRRLRDEARLEGPQGAVLLSVEVLRRWPPLVIRGALLTALEELAGESSASYPVRLPRSVFEAVLEGVREGGAGCRGIEFRARGGGGPEVRVEVKDGMLAARLLQAFSREPGPEVLVELPRAAPRGVCWGAWELEFEEIEKPEGAGEERGWDFDTSRLTEQVDADAVRAAGSLRVRSRRPGERVWPLGAPGRKSLKEFLREEGVRPEERDAVPIVAAGESIVWVVGCRIADPFRLQAATRRILVLRARRSPQAAPRPGKRS